MRKVVGSCIADTAGSLAVRNLINYRTKTKKHKKHNNKKKIIVAI
jgi:hypothetical protein